MRVLSSAIPVIVVFVCCYFCAEWSQIQVYKEVVFEKTEKGFLSLQEKYICKENEKYYIRFQEIEKNQGKEKNTLVIRFLKSQLAPVSLQGEYQRCVWTLGVVEYLHNGKWIPMFPSLNKGVDFQIPVTFAASNGWKPLDNDDKTPLFYSVFFFNMVQHQLLKDNGIGVVEVLEADCSPKKIITHAQN